ncbi:Short-chain dehydrogenase/reductase tropE [Pseudocercospora fuligena]|uniref:Short-chain dehydrogenase/reductase tropE n=1 Tax=Pseudocercospora fuligena TaxID=685502 RepID=A0A8H6RQD1_9PEZI|nr:Short-chain dehydrogenase/reductase tropE [Pseudocercospora fuligena]
MKNKIILVTGANRGIGFSTIQALSQRSSDVTLIVAARTQAKAEEAVNQLRSQGSKGQLQPIELDVTQDDSVSKAVTSIGEKYGRLDVLINNAGIAPTYSSTDIANLRSSWATVLDTNVTSIALVSTLFLPLLRASRDPKVLNVSSARGSLALVTSGANPPTDKIAYSVSKVALNLLTVEMSHSIPELGWQVASPGWCKTAFNGFRGPKDPFQGAQVLVELALAAKGQYENGFWQFEDGKMETVPW